MMMMNNNTNNRFKTAMCKHFEQSKWPTLGGWFHIIRWSLSYGPEMPFCSWKRRTPCNEWSNLFSSTDWLKIRQNQNSHSFTKTFGGGDQNNQSGNSYKKTRCKFFDQGNCRFGQSCHFAHGEQDLRATVTRYWKKYFSQPSRIALKEVMLDLFKAKWPNSKFKN